MINSLVGALTLTAKIGICIAVFAVLIIVEILALVMLAKWKKNYKATAVQNESAVEDARSEVIAQSQQDSVQEAETQAQDEPQDVETAEDSVQDAEEGQSDDKRSAFAFAPLMLLSAPAMVTSLRYVLYALIGVSVALAIAVLATAISFSKSLTKATKEQPADEPASQDGQQPEEAVQPQQPVEEAVEESAEEPAEESVEEPVEEPVAEEIVAEEEPTEEVLEDEQSVEEQPAVEEEPIEEAVEQPVVEEEPMAEAVEEQPAVEEKPTHEETVFVVEQPIPMFVKPKHASEKIEENVRERTVIIDNVTYTMKDERYLFNPAENDWYITLTKTYLAKLIQSEDHVKDYYTELKNELLSYKKVHSRISKKRESFNFGRVCLARLSIRGKTLRLHLALDANNYVETKFVVEDTSSVKSLADTPLMYRIKNDRRLKYAKELIAEVMAQAGTVKQEIEPVDYKAMYPYEETEPLIERGLIIRKWYQGKVPDSWFDFAQKSFKAKLIQSDEVVKEYYSHLKNELLSYRKIHDRMSKKRESYRFGRDCVARMAIRGKTLKLYLALDPNDYVDSKYKVEDASDVKSFADTPLVIKIKNPRRLKHAMELIAVTMEKFGTTTKRDINETDYVSDLPFESTEELLEKGLVKNVHVKGNSFVAQHFSIKKTSDEDDEVASDEAND